MQKSYDVEETNKQLQKCIFTFIGDNPFYGAMLQTIPIQFNFKYPTAALSYDKEHQNYRIYVNPEFFSGLSEKERVGVFHHEILHFVHQHLVRFGKEYEKNSEATKSKKVKDAVNSMLDNQLINVACDMAINQLIKNLPKDCIDYKNFKQDDGTAFPALQTAELYYNLLKNNDNFKKEMTQEELDKLLSTLDVHDWEGNEGMSDEDKKDMLKATEKIVERAMEKSGYGWGQVPGELQELLQKLKNDIQKLNYKQILANAIKRTVSSTDRKRTWTRPSKYYGNVAPGTKLGDSPKLEFYFDLSGSISITEMNEFLRIIDEFINVGERRCRINLFDTRIFKQMKYKKGQTLEKKDISGGGGGTCLNEVIKHVQTNNPDLSIVLTDGYYGDVQYKPKHNEMFFIISSNGTEKHPLQAFGKTIHLKNLK